MPQETKCPHCGAQMKEWKHRMTPALVDCLKALAWAVRADNKNDVEFGEINMSFSQRNNFQKLRYWGLIAHVKENGEKIKGRWLLTRNGGRFLRGEIRVPKIIKTWRNRIVHRSTEVVSIWDVTKEPWSDYYQKEFAFDVHLPDEEMDLTGNTLL